MSWPRYALITEGSFMRLSAATQLELVNEAVLETGVSYKNLNAAQRWATIRRAQDIRRNEAQGGQRKPPAQPTITAAEVNNWLQSLPSTPLFGERIDD
jgi:hypothetical protein